MSLEELEVDAAEEDAAREAFGQQVKLHFFFEKIYILLKQYSKYSLTLTNITFTITID